MAAKDLQHCAQLLSQMLDKDTGPVNTQGGIQTKRARALSASHSTKPFLTTGRLSRKALASKSTKSRASKVSGKSKAACSSLKPVKTPNKDREREFDDELSSLSREFLASHGSQQKREDLKNSISRFLADQDAKTNANTPKGFRVPSAERGSFPKSDGRRMSPPVPVLYNHRLTCSTPNETPKRLVDLGDTLILNGSTGTQVLNATDEVRAMLKPEKKGPIPKLVRANIDIVPNPSATEASKDQLVASAPLSSTKAVRILGRDAGDADLKQMFKSPNSRHVVIGLQKKSTSSSSDFPVKSVAVGNHKSSTGLEIPVRRIAGGNSMHDASVGNSMHGVVGNSMCNIDAENSIHNVGAKYSMHSTDEGEAILGAGNSVLSLSHPTERSAKHSEKFKKLDYSQYDRKHLKEPHSPAVVTRKSGSMVDLSSDRAADLLPSNSFRTGSTLKDASGRAKREKESTNYQSSMVRNGVHDFDACGDNLDVEIKGHENSDKMRLVTLLKQVKDVISEKQNCRISRLINEIQDVVSNTPTKSAMPLSTDIDTELALQPLRSENAQLRRRIRILNQQLREKEKLLEAVAKPDPSFQVLHLSMLNQHLEKELGGAKDEMNDLRKMNEELQKELDKVVQEKADMLQVIAKKDDDHVKSLRDKMVEISQAKSDFDEMQTERQGEVEQLKTQVKHLEFDLAQKHKEVDQAQNLIRSLQGSMSRLVHDLQSSRPYPAMVNSGHLSETLKSVKDQIMSSTLNKTHSAEDSSLSSHTTLNQHNDLQHSNARQALPKPFNFNAETQKNTTINSSQTKNSRSNYSAALPTPARHSSDSSTTRLSFERVRESDARFDESNTRRIEEWKRQAEAAWPSAGITVKDLLMNPEASQALYSAARANFTDFDNLKSFSDVEDVQNSTLVEIRDREKTEFAAVAQNGPDMSRHSIADYFKKYNSSNAFNADHDRKSTVTLSQLSQCSPNSTTYSGSYQEQSYPDSRTEDEAISIHMSDFNNLSGDHRHSSEVDSDASDFEDNAAPRTKKTEARNNRRSDLDLKTIANHGLASSFRMEETRESFDVKLPLTPGSKNTAQDLVLSSLRQTEAGSRLGLDLSSLHIADTESTGTTCTLSSLGTIGSIDDQSFKDSLASLDANIALIQENLRRDLALKYPTLANSS